jgi:hypothetical protein
MLRRIVWYIPTDIEDLTASIISAMSKMTEAVSFSETTANVY